MIEKTEDPTKKVKFTERQLSIMKLWSELPNESAIADQLNISKHTVHTHLRRMREKLVVQRTFDIWKYLKEENLLQ